MEGAKPGPTTASPELGAHQFASFAKGCSIYQRQHPRVRDTALDVAHVLRSLITPPRWLVLRVGGRDIVMGDTVVASSSPAMDWLVERCRESGLVGIQFAPDVDAEALIDFGVALGRSGGRRGKNLREAWPANHAKVRPLDLVFAGDHVDLGLQAENVAPGTAAREIWKLELLEKFARDQSVQQRIQALASSCEGEKDEHCVDIDVFEEILDLMPAEVACDPEQATEMLRRVLDRMHAGIVELQRGEKGVDDGALMRRALAVAKKYFENTSGPVVLRDKLPAGRPEDAGITPNLELLLREFDGLPAARDLQLPDAATFAAGAARTRTESLGICLHLLGSTERAETMRSLAKELPKILGDLDEDRIRVLDAYLRPLPGEWPSEAGDDVAVKILGFLAQLGRHDLVAARHYVSPGLIQRTFPTSFVLVAHACGSSPAGIELLRRGLEAVGPARIAAGAGLLAKQGLLVDRALVESVVAVGGRLVLPMIAQVAARDDVWVRELVVTYLRTLTLPDMEAAALRCIDPPTLLPSRYLVPLCRAAERGQDDPTVRALSGQLLRAFVDGADARMPLDRRLKAIAGLRYLPGPETRALVARLAKDGRFTSFGPAARAVRKTAHEVLVRMPKEAR